MTIPRSALLLLLAACTAGGDRDDAAGAVPPGEVTPAAVSYREGKAGAPVHVIYFADFVCDDCAKFSGAAVDPLRAEWLGRGRARLTVVDLPWHRGSVAGSAAASCAADQGKYWEMHDLLFERQEVWKRAADIPAKLQEYAQRQLQLDSAAFARCAADQRHRRRADEADEAARRFAIRGTPAFVVNGKVHYGSQDWRWVEQVLLATERGRPDSAPPPPPAIPMKRVVDSARLREMEAEKAGTRD